MRYSASSHAGLPYPERTGAQSPTKIVLDQKCAHPWVSKNNQQRRPTSVRAEVGRDGRVRPFGILVSRLVSVSAELALVGYRRCQLVLLGCRSPSDGWQWEDRPNQREAGIELAKSSTKSLRRIVSRRRPRPSLAEPLQNDSASVLRTSHPRQSPSFGPFNAERASSPAHLHSPRPRVRPRDRRPRILLAHTRVN